MRRASALIALLVLGAPVQAEEAPRFPGLLVQTRDGLIALPLERTRYEVELLGPIAAVEVHQIWRCPMREPVDATYVGALPPGAALTGLTLRAGDRRAEGRLEARREAWQRWREARDAGRQALFAENADGLVQQTLSNLRPGEVVEVELRYLVELQAGARGAELTLPLVIAPRRDARGAAALPVLHGERPQQLPDAIAWTHRAEVHVLARGLTDAATLTSPTHALDSRRVAAGVEATLRGGAQIADRDLVLRVAEPAQRAASARAADGATQIILRWAPDAVARTQARDLVIVLDEGALRAPPVRAQAWATVEAMVARARADDRVLVLGAGASARRSSPAPLHPGAGLRAALRRMRAEPARDGGDVAESLRKERGAKDRARAIVLFTDAALEDASGVVGDLAENDRLVVLALGAAPAHGRLERWMRAPRTAALIAAPLESGSELALRADAASAVVLRDLAVQWEGGLVGAELASPLPRELGGGAPLVISARVPNDGGAGAAVLRGRTAGGEPISQRIEVAPPSRDVRLAALLGGAWARRRLITLTGSRDGADAAQATAIAIAHGQASEWTSFVAIDHGSGGAASARLVAVPLPAPYAGAGEVRAGMSADRIRPGDPEVQIDAPSNTRRVTLLLPTGELKPCARDARTGRWVANFLIANDRQEGIYAVRVLIELEDGTRLRRRLRYQVDAAAPEVDVALEPETPAPGAEVELVLSPRPRPIRVEPEADDIGDPSFAARVRDDVEAVIALLPDGELREVPRAADGRYRLRFRAPAARGRYQLMITARDGARNGARLVRVLRVGGE